MANKITRAQPPATIPEHQGPMCKYNKFTMLPTVIAMAKIGATNADIADALNISLCTFTSWCSQFPELREAVTVGKPRIGRACAWLFRQR
jgi:hypothetical protein